MLALAGVPLIVFALGVVTFTTTILFQFARYERFFDRAAMERYAKAAREPKDVKWYDTGHDLNDVQALLDRAAWLREKVGLGPVLRPGRGGE